MSYYKTLYLYIYTQYINNRNKPLSVLKLNYLNVGLIVLGKLHYLFMMKQIDHL